MDCAERRRAELGIDLGSYLRGVFRQSLSRDVQLAIGLGGGYRDLGNLNSLCRHCLPLSSERTVVGTDSLGFRRKYLCRGFVE